jgi:hypothetical protein
MAAILQEPEIWNPNVMRSATTSNPVPTRFRIVAISTDPNSAAAYGSLVSMSATNISVSPECIEWNGDTATNVPSSPGPVWNESNAELDFNISAGSQYLFREPTLLVKPGIPAGSNLSVGQSSLLAKGFGAYILSQWPAAQYNGTGVTDNREYIGFLSGTAPVAWGGSVGGGANNGGQTGIGGIGESGTSPIPANSVGGGVLGAELVYSPGAVPAITYRLQYMDPFGNWATYDEKYADYLIATSYNFGGQSNGDLNHVFGPTISGTSAPDNIGSEIDEAPMDPRTGRFGMRTAGRCGQRSQVCQDFPPVTWNWGDGWSGGPGGAGASQNAIMTLRPDPNTGFEFSRWQNAQNNGSVLWQGVNTGPTEPGWSPGPLTLAPDDADHSYDVIIPGLFAQNNPALAAVPSGGYTSIIEISGTIGSTSQPSIPAGGWNQTGSTLNEFFADADGVVRRSMAAYVPVTGSSVAVAPASGQPSGIPMETAYSVASGGVTATPETSSRPMILNRPFLSVADLGYVFSGTPWRNLDVSTPESGFAGLLDAFCVNDNSDPNGLVAGKVNLNTRQAPVIEAILSGAYRDEFNPVAPAVSGTAWPITGPLTGGTEAVAITGALIARTNPATLTGANGPLANLSELAGKWIGPVGVQSASAPPYDGSQSYTGFSNDLANQPNSFDADTTPGVLADTFRRVARFREAATRALANAGQTRVWNLMIDVVAQTGRYPATAAGAGNPLASFLVEGQQRYWVHVAIDRYSGQVIDKQIEVVRQ